MRFTSVLAAAFVLAVPSAFAQQPGDLWEITTSMEMDGMKMPGQKQQVCAPADAEGPEAMAADERCQMTDMQRSPGKFTYKVQCPDGSGTGEMVYQGKDSYTSTMKMTVDGDTMTMVSTGKRVRSCDASAMDKTVAKFQAQAAANKDEACAEVSKAMMPSQLEAGQCDAKHKKQLCDRFATREGFREVAVRQPTGNASVDADTVDGIAKYCGVSVDPIRDRLCNDAVKTSASDDLKFIGEACPAQTRTIAQRECAGRGFTTPPAQQYRAFCSDFAREMMDGSYQAEPSPEEAAKPAGDSAASKATDAVKEGAKRLKGLFGR